MSESMLQQVNVFIRYSVNVRLKCFFCDFFLPEFQTLLCVMRRTECRSGLW